MKIFIIVIAIIFASGCERASWEMAPTNHECTEEEMNKVEKESLWCSENTGYIKSYCYGTAIIRNCQSMKEKI